MKTPRHVHPTRLMGGLLAAILAGSPAFAQSAPATPKDQGGKPAADSPEKTRLETSLTAAETALKDKDADGATKALIDLGDIYKNVKLEDKDKKRIVESVGKFLRSSEAKVQKSGAEALGNMGSDGAKYLKAALGDKDLKENDRKEVRLAVVESLGRTKDPSESKTLLNLLKDKDSDVIAAAARGLGHYNDAKEGVRKDIAKEMINILDSAYNGANDPKNTTAIKKFDVIRDPMMTALNSITGHTVNNAGEWRKWYNDNKNNKW
ncbi:MAG: HEAT repeat domain-containing protein [Planctomycetes bacterium]|nr:HEAT repeat domain-containing protein [Planctomycetota bacterium]MBI3847473.1 HEAT repeat domain-containing protein [Planctomycetota bacterium]